MELVGIPRYFLKVVPNWQAVECRVIGLGLLVYHLVTYVLADSMNILSLKM